MARKTTPETFRRLVHAARASKPHMAVTTDVIAGFPGETEKEFAESLEFLNEMEFAGGHVFTYSPRPGTAAARLPGQIPAALSKERNHILYEALESSALRYRQGFIDQTLQVLWESTSELGEFGWQMEGYTGNYIRVSAAASSPRWNQIDPVRLQGLRGEGLEGIIQNS
jgi:threonylcarbamoyladenosine tRNA methylthiotransferase MtaB